MGLRLPSRPLDLLAGRPRLAVGDVVLDRVVEQERILGHDADQGAQRVDGEAAEVVPIEGDAPRGDVVEAWQELHEGGLAGARHAHEGHQLALADGEGDVLERPLLRIRVAEPGAHELDRPGERGHRIGPGSVHDRGRGVEDLEHALHRGDRLLHGVDHPGQLADGPVEQHHRRGEREELAGGQRARDHAVAAVPERPHDRERAQHLHQRLRHLVDAAVFQGQAQEPVVDRVEALLLEPFAAERLDDLGAGEGLLQHHVQLGDLLLGAPVDLVELAADDAHRDAHDREHRDRDQGEHPLSQEHDGEQGRDRPHVSHRHHQHGGGEAGQAVHVGHHPGHQIPRVQGGEERQRHRLDVRVELAPDARDHALPHGGHEVGLAEAARALQQVGPEQGEGDDPQHRHVALQEDVVHGRLHQPGDQGLRPRDQQREQPAHHQDRPVGPQVGQQAQEQAVARVHRRPPRASSLS